jgi:hypothetical protein
MKKYIYGFLVLAAVVGAVFFVKARAQQCNTQSGTVTGYTGGDASALSTLNGIVNDDLTHGARLRLKNKGANFVTSAGYPVTTNLRMTAAAADFNGDGLCDLAEGGRQCDNNSNPTDTNLSIFTSLGVDPLNPNKFKFNGPYYINYVSTFTTYEIIALGAGDFDGDGDNDIAALDWQGKLWIFWNRYSEHHDSPGCAPDFDPKPTLAWSLNGGDLIQDGYGEFGSSSSKWRWESNIAVVDVDRDGRPDLIVGIGVNTGKYGEVVVCINNGNGTFSPITAANRQINPYPSLQYGVSAVAAADFRHSGYIDFIVGSAGSSSTLPAGTPTSLYFYKNDGLGNFSQDATRTATIPASRGSCACMQAGDFDGDGNVDFFLSTDGSHNSLQQGGYVYWYKNDGTGHFTANPIPSSGARTSPSGDLDGGAVGDFDGNGAIDFEVCDGNDSQSVYFFMNQFQPTYVSTGTVNSKNRLACSFFTSGLAVVSATLHKTDSTPAGTTIAYYLSNSDDQNGNPLWEGPVTPNVEWTFASPGNFLRWQAIMTTSNETVTPVVSSVTLDYKYITTREYSRTSQATTVADVNGDGKNEEVLYSASFEFPTWNGHLRSWNVSNLSLGYSRQTQLADITNVGALAVADAGPVLNGTAWNSRTVYTAYDATGDGVMNDRLNFSLANDTTIDDYLGLGQGSPNVDPLIQFVLGYNRTWKLGDINHSSPQSLDPPSENPTLMGSGYDTFKAANANRQRAILAGANDGMLHCFDATTLQEMWAFIPNNLLYKLKMMKVVDPDCGTYMSHQFFVDGTAAIQDVYFNGGWHTVLVTGQGPGWGKNHQWYYFCLDITDPMNPQTLWELTDIKMGETWSVPTIGKIHSTGQWVAFFGSGYDTLNQGIGNYFYAVDVATGQILNSFKMAETTEPISPFGIKNTLPSSASLVDIDSDGYVESVYIGDLLGRLWKIDLTRGVNQWTPSIIYRDPYNYPIITKPAVYISPADNSVHLYFGTGGDDKASSTAYYSFVALKDGSPATVDWYMGPDDMATKLGIGIGLKRGQFAQGEKIWADDVISDRICYIATLTGSIESLNPCLALTGSGNIYARNVQGTNVGGSALIGAGGTTIEYLQTAQKVRSAVTVGNKQTLNQQGQPAVNVRKVYIQSFTQPAGGAGPQPPSQVMAQPVQNSVLLIKSWREVYKIIR